MTGGTQIAEAIPLTTRELLAAILLYSEKTTLSEREICEHVANVRMVTTSNHISSISRVRICLAGFLADGVLAYDGASDQYRYNPRNADYLRGILENAKVVPQMTEALHRLILAATPQHTPVATLRSGFIHGEVQ